MKCKSFLQQTRAHHSENTSERIFLIMQTMSVFRKLLVHHGVLSRAIRTLKGRYMICIPFQILMSRMILLPLLTICSQSRPTKKFRKMLTKIKNIVSTRKILSVLSFWHRKKRSNIWRRKIIISRQCSEILNFRVFRVL